MVDKIILIPILFLLAIKTKINAIDGIINKEESTGIVFIKDSVFESR